MKSDIRAGIDLHQALLRYAEVEHYGSRHRLLRLGSCDFAFDVAAEVFRTDEPEYLGTVAEALGDVFAGSVATELEVLVHPPDCYSFFTPVPVGTEASERRQRLHQEASLLTQDNATEALHLTDELLYTETLDEEQVEWYHVLAIEERIHKRLGRILEAVPDLSYRPRSSMYGVTAAMSALYAREAEKEEPLPAYTLTVGWYSTHTEYTVCHGSNWYFSHYTPAGSPTDCAYFAVTLLNRMKLLPRVIQRIYLYGQEVDVSQFRLLQSIFGVAPRRLNAMHIVDQKAERFTASFNAEAYAPCIGGTL